MNHEPTIQDVLFAINDFSTNVDERFNQVDQRFEKVDKRFDKIEQRLDKVENRLDKIDVRLDKVEQKVDTLEYRMDDMRSVMVTKDHLETRLTEFKSDIVTEIDRFVTLHQTLDVEIVSLRHRCDRMEHFIVRAAKKLELDYEPA